MTKEIYIRFRDGEKESELRIDAIDSHHQLALMDGVFKFFNVDVDFNEMASIYHRSGKAYQEFFENQVTEVDYIDEVSNKVPKIDAEEYAKAFEETAIETPAEDKEPTRIEKPVKQVESYMPGYHHAYDPLNTDYFTTGIKYNSIGKPQYKCRYKCPNCHDEANHYIKIDMKHVRCWNCQRMLKISPATAHGEPKKEKDPELYRDSNGNFFIAGAFEMDIRTLSDAENETEDPEFE